jgi:hypothetical protein
MVISMAAFVSLEKLTLMTTTSGSTAHLATSISMARSTPPTMLFGATTPKFLSARSVVTMFGEPISVGC